MHLEQGAARHFCSNAKDQLHGQAQHLTCRNYYREQGTSGILVVLPGFSRLPASCPVLVVTEHPSLVHGRGKTRRSWFHLGAGQTALSHPMVPLLPQPPALSPRSRTASLGWKGAVPWAHGNAVGICQAPKNKPVVVYLSWKGSNRFSCAGP